MVAGLAGNAEAYHQLLEAVAQRLRVYFTRRAGADCADLEDLVQETLIAIHRKRASYDRTLPFTAWLHAIARYKLIDHLRQHGVRKHVDRKSVVTGKRVSVRVDLGGRRILKKKKNNHTP